MQDAGHSISGDAGSPSQAAGSATEQRSSSCNTHEDAHSMRPFEQRAGCLLTSATYRFAVAYAVSRQAVVYTDGVSCRVIESKLLCLPSF
jgi:hypothetical protein